MSVTLFLWFTQHACKGTPITQPFQNKAESDFTASVGLIEHLSEDSSTCGEKIISIFGIIFKSREHKSFMKKDA